MDTIDQQLDAANNKITELEAANKAVSAENETLKATNAELADNLTASKAALAAKEQELAAANATIDTLKAEAKSAEERAAEFYGAQAGAPVAASAAGDEKARPIKERFKECKTPAAQTTFIRNLSPEERDELFK